MTLDADRLAALRADREHDLAQQEADWRERCLTESIEAEEAYWVGVMAAMPDTARHVVYSRRPWLNRGADDG